MSQLGPRLDALSHEHRMLHESAAAFFGAKAGHARMRSHRGHPPGYSDAVWTQMADLGWLGMCLPERWGGNPVGLLGAALLLEQSGRALAPEPLTAVAIMAAAAIGNGNNDAIKAHVLPRLVAGTSRPTLAWQDEVEVTTRTRKGATVLRGGKRLVCAALGADAFIVSARQDDGTALYLVRGDAPGLTLETVPRVDGGFWGRLRLEDVEVGEPQLVADAGTGQGVLEHALDLGRIAASAELLGVMSRALEITVDYVRTREQFGRPVGAFQAVQHRAVDMLMQCEVARSVLLQSVAAFEEAGSANGRAVAASQVKARCSDAALRVVRGCIQLHGGIGYTDECDIGLFLKRAMVLAGWLGGADEHRQRYGKLAASTADAPVSAEDDVIAPMREWVAANFPTQWRFPSYRLTLRETACWHRQLYEKGWAAPNWPREWGGAGLSPYEQVLFQEVLDRHGVDITVNMGVLMLGPLLIRYGSEEQKRRYLPRILSGETLWCQGYSEPGAGSDLASLRTSAVPDQDSFVVNGQKIWTSQAHEADMIFLLARTDKSVPKQKGISFLLVDMKSPGITVKRITNLTGNREFCEVFFDNVRVPRENLVGEVNQGWSMAKALLGSERIMIGNPRIARYPMQLLARMAAAAGQFSDPVFMARYIELQLDVEDHGAMFVRFAEALRRGQELGPEVSMLKIWITETYQRVAELMCRTFPELATLDAPTNVDERRPIHVANQYLASLPASIYSGTNEILRNVLAKTLLDLPSQ